MHRMDPNSTLDVQRSMFDVRIKEVMVFKFTRMPCQGADILRPLTGGVAALNHRLQAVTPLVSLNIRNSRRR